MTVSPVELASLLCSRLCHDLLSPVGALNNGLELLADETDPAMRERCMELLSDSARVSANKLKFYRLAFGSGGGYGDAIDARETESAVRGLVSDNKRIELGWLVAEPTLPKPATKVLLNLVLLAVDALVRGGSLDVGAEAGERGAEIVVKLEAPRIMLDPELRRTITDGEGEGGVTARSAPAYITHELVAASGGTIQVSEPAEGVMILGATLRAG
ncbi:MAG TPA: histidine phosphotransferase family protein [Sphingomonas sp.]